MHPLRLRLLPAALLFAATLARLAAQQPLENAVFTVGTTTVDAQSKPWAYLALQPTDPELLRSRSLAIYAKPGDSTSPSNYVRVSITALQTDPATLQTIVTRAGNLGDDLNQLQTRLDNLFAAVIPSTNLDLPTKLSIVIRGALNTPENFGNMVLLGRLHPSVTVALGLGQLLPVNPGLTTFEVRDFDPVANQDKSVLGRVTVNSASPVVMPAPGQPFLVPDASGKGHLNAKLRWATSPDSRRLALLSQGFDLYRVPKAVAEASGYTNTTPTAAQLRGNPAAVLVNSQPIFKTKDFDTDAQAADMVADATTFFISDDNGLAKARPAGQPAVRFNNGDKFYYFVTARDILGRQGVVSPGTLVTMCDRVPPYAPHIPSVVNNYSYTGGVEVQWLQVNWRPVTNTTATNSTILGYQVYRWTSPAEALKYGGDPASHLISPLIPHVPGQTNYSFLDNGAGAPSAPADFGLTYWYTVRSVDNGACDGGNVSPNSSAAFGVLRNRNGPAAPGGGSQINCCQPEVIGLKQIDAPPTDGSKPDPTLLYFDLQCVRSDRGIVWAEFVVVPYNGGTNSIGRFEFPANTDQIDELVTYSRALSVNQPGERVYCRVGDAFGNSSQYALVDAEGLPREGIIRTFPFNALTLCNRVLAGQALSAAGIPGCTTHQNTPGPGGAVATNSGINVIITPTPGTAEYKLYRRIDFGPLTLLKEAPGDYSAATNFLVQDTDMPANSGTICYYAQLFDINGNASPMTQIGPCVDYILPTATPILNPIAALGDATMPEMSLHWFCPVVGVERFEVLVHASPGATPMSFGAPLADDSATHPNYIAPNPSHPATKFDFNVYQTPTPGNDFGPGPAFTLPLPVQLGVTYIVQIRTIGKGGAESRGSKFQTFKWVAPPATQGPQVPWPKRPTFDASPTPAGVAGVRLSNSVYAGAGVIIGKVARQQLGSNTNKTIRPNLAANVQSSDLIFTNKQGVSLFPLALYRYQSPNFFYPKPSGDMVQVSPLMSEIVLVPGLDDAQQPSMLWKEPFAIVDITLGNSDIGAPVVLLDTQPVVANATYVYLLVHFGTDGEPAEIYPTQPVTITP